jgi:uncharacterized protein with HEPN domain
MRRKLDVYLWEVRKHAQSILHLTAGTALAQYRANRILRLAVEREFTIIGEALVRLRQDFPEAFDEIDDAAELVRFRNRLVHFYDLMRDEEVWQIITACLPPMTRQLTSMIEELQK